jgi:hypothetical protein
MKIVLAIPTIEARGTAWEDVAAVWIRHTCQPLTVIPSWRPSSWCDGLNEAWEQAPDADLFIAASDDMVPQDDYWLPAIEPYLEQGCIAPQVLDPRFARFDATVSDGDHTNMSSFPIIAGRFLDKVFPLPTGLHYYGDNYISEKRLTPQGIPTIAVPSCVIVHNFDERGRGAGMGDESTRMAYDREMYRSMS